MRAAYSMLTSGVLASWAFCGPLAAQERHPASGRGTEVSSAGSENTSVPATGGGQASSFLQTATGDPAGNSPSSANDPLAGLSVRLGVQWRLIFDASNFAFHPATLDDSQKSQSFFNQRFRTWLLVSPKENIEGYLQVEMGHILWTENFDFPKTYAGPFSPAGDRVGVELRRGYLTYKSEELGTFRAGIQDWHDAFGESPTLGTDAAVDDYDSFGAVLANSIWDFNVGGLSYIQKFPDLADLTMNAGVFVLWEGDVQQADDALLFALDLDWPVLEKHSVGFSVYYLADHDQYSYPTVAPYDSAWDVWLGARAKAALTPVPLQGFVILNVGQRNELGGVPDFEHAGVALKLVAGPVAVGPTKVSFQTLYATGEEDPTSRDSSEFRTIAQSARDNFGSAGYWSYFILTSPHGPSDVNDLGVSLQNRGLGLFTVQAKCEYPIYGRLSGMLAAGWLQAAADNPISQSREMGTELVNAFAFDFGGGLTADFGVAVLFTGHFYKPAPIAPDPDVLWEAFTRVQLEF